MNKKRKQEVLVSIIVAVRNEEEHIEECIQSLLKQTFTDFEILLIDGESNDKTLQILQQYAKKYPLKIRSFSNREQKVAQGRNIGFAHAKGVYIGFLDGHSYANKNWLKTLIDALESSNETVGGIGSVHYNADKKLFTIATTLVMSSILGGGGTSYKPGKKLREVPTAYACLYKKEALLAIKKGEEYYNPYFIKGQDAEMNIRLKKAGYKILRHPKAKTYYYKRPNLKAFWRQMVNAGFWRVKIIKHHPDTIRKTWTVFAPAIFFTISVLLLLFGFIHPLFAIGGIGLLGTYIGISILFGLSQIIKKRKVYYGITTILLLALHVSYTIGLIKGIFKRNINIIDRVKQ